MCEISTERGDKKKKKGYEKRERIGFQRTYRHGVGNSVNEVKRVPVPDEGCRCHGGSEERVGSPLLSKISIQRERGGRKNRFLVSRGSFTRGKEKENMSRVDPVYRRGVTERTGVKVPFVSEGLRQKWTTVGQEVPARVKWVLTGNSARASKEVAKKKNCFSG